MYYTIGLENESQRYASLLGYNYQSSKWYEASYKILNQDYDRKKKNIVKDDKETLLKKFKDLFILGLSNKEFISPWKNLIFVTKLHP